MVRFENKENWQLIPENRDLSLGQILTPQPRESIQIEDRRQRGAAARGGTRGEAAPDRDRSARCHSNANRI